VVRLARRAAMAMMRVSVKKVLTRLIFRRMG
jgi:hypothetical protein